MSNEASIFRAAECQVEVAGHTCSGDSDFPNIRDYYFPRVLKSLPYIRRKPRVPNYLYYSIQKNAAKNNITPKIHIYVDGFVTIDS